MEIKQGWQCPKCKIIYAPHIDKCECETISGHLGDKGVPNYVPLTGNPIPWNLNKITCVTANPNENIKVIY